MAQQKTKIFRIAQLGTFEAENYGDLLFPLILERELRERLGSVELTLFSPLAGPFPADPSISVKAITPDIFEKNGQSFDAFIVGGGDIISFRKEIAPVYNKNWHELISAHAACWALASACRSTTTPILWNAPGVPYDFSSSQSFIVQELCSEVEYLSVRDDLSRERLLRTKFDKEVFLTPDTALLLPKHFPRETLFPRAQKILQSLGLDSQNLFVFQIAPHFLGSNAAAVTQLLQKLSQKYSMQILLLPIGYCHEDQTALERIHAQSAKYFAFSEAKLHILDIAALIACARAFAGSSLHGAITAFAYNVPHLIINTGSIDKLTSFAHLIVQPDCCIQRWEDFSERIESIFQSDSSKTQATLKWLHSKIDTHFDRMSQIISNSSNMLGDRDEGASTNKTVQKKLSNLRSQLLHQALTQQATQSHGEAELRARIEEIELFTQSHAWQIAHGLRRLGQFFPLPRKFLFPVARRAGKLLLSLRSKTPPAKNEKNKILPVDVLKSALDYPRFSLIMTLDGQNEGWMRESINSIFAQKYPHWELIVVGDARLSERSREILQAYQLKDVRVKAQLLSTRLSLGEMTNQALKTASGEFVGFLLEASDVLDPNLLLETVSLLNQESTADLIYFDHAMLDEDTDRTSPWHKPGWCPDLLLSMNYIGNFVIVRKRLLDQVGGLCPEFTNNELYEFLLRATEQTRKISRIPQILYRSRNFTREKNLPRTETAIRALQAALSRRHLTGHIEATAPDRYQVRYAIKGNPKISVIIPTKDKLELLRPCIESIESKTLYKNYELLVVDNQSVEPATQNYLKTLGQKHNVLTYAAPFNYSKLNNFAVEHAAGDYLLFLNNDTQIIAPEWMSALLEHAQRPEVGAVGAKLLFPDGSTQHAGVIVGISGLAGHAFRFQPPASSYFGLANVIRNYSAVTGACLMMRTELFKRIGGFDEKLAVGLQDIDLCLRLREQDYLIVYTPCASLYHFEKTTRGSQAPLKDEHLFKECWHEFIERGDPYYNPNLTLESESHRPGPKIAAPRKD
jgi:GT2 family glycosyltransferase/polysaccharide pyruvyl transferase WcaK-like protein